MFANFIFSEQDAGEVVMYAKLAEVTLKTGEPMEVGVVTAPDTAHAEEMKRFLGHKPGTYKWHIQRCVTETLDTLETRFYVGKLDSQVIVNIMTVESEGIGILGHVFTEPAQRRKGACKGVMAYQMSDFRDRNGTALYLGTGYDSPPYHIYHAFGFESVFPDSGFMKYLVDAESEARYFAPTAAQPKSVAWHDWPKLTALSGIVGSDTLRSLKWGMYGPTNFEGGFLAFKHDLETTDTYIDAKLLRAASGAIVGWATLSRDTRWHPETVLLDLFFHPNFTDAVPDLLAALDLPDTKCQCYVDSGAAEKASVLESFGFIREARLTDQITYRDQKHDIHIFARG